MKTIITEIKCLVNILNRVFHIDEERITELENIAEHINFSVVQRDNDMENVKKRLSNMEVSLKR